MFFIKIVIWYVVLSAFDAAGPIYNSLAADRLKPTSCEIVYAVYTNAAFLGYAQRLGTINVYVNGGYDQPGCDLLTAPFCSHWRAVFLDISHREHPNTFYVTSKKGKYLFLDQINTPPGEYYMDTSKYWPFFPKKQN